jgi:hypothetical protein
MGIKRTLVSLQPKQRDALVEVTADDLPFDLLERLRTVKLGSNGLIEFECNEYELDILIGSLTFEVNHQDEEDARKLVRLLKSILVGYREQLKV